MYAADRSASRRAGISASCSARKVIRLDGSINDREPPGTVIDATPMKVATEANRPTSAKLAMTAAFFTRASTRSPSVVPSWIRTPRTRRTSGAASRRAPADADDSRPRRNASSVAVGFSSSASSHPPQVPAHPRRRALRDVVDAALQRLARLEHHRHRAEQHAGLEVAIEAVDGQPSTRRRTAPRQRGSDHSTAASAAQREQASACPTPARRSRRPAQPFMPSHSASCA